MVDFLRISTRPTKSGILEVFPKFIVGKSKDVMIKGGDFYAVWLEDRGIWSTDEQDVIDLVDRELTKFADDYKKRTGVQNLLIQYMWDGDSGVIDRWHKYCQKQMRDMFSPLNQNLAWSNQPIKKEDYVAKILPYAVEEGPMDAYEQVISTLYSPENRHKIEWCIGAIVTGDSKKIQKFLVLYGEKGTGKSTIIDIIMKMFDGYYCVFDAKSVGSASKEFAMEPFKDNPVLGIQHDGDLSHLDDNTRLNSLTSHEKLIINEKHKSLYALKLITFLIMGTNYPVKVTDAKSGVTRRMIDANPTGKRIPRTTYLKLVEQIDFELGAIAYHCKQVYLSDKHYYDDYIPLNMMGETNDFFNFVEDNYAVFKKDNQTTLKEAWAMYKEYIEAAQIKYPLNRIQVKAELKVYFEKYDEDYQDPTNGVHARNFYRGFKYQMFDANKKFTDAPVVTEPDVVELINMKKQHSLLDDYCAECPAQYASSAETPSKKWAEVTTTMKDLDSSKIHYLKPPSNIIVIDFDLKDEMGKKSYQKNLEAASKWPKTYTECSKSGSGIHLHYIYDGDVNQLSRIYDEDVEIKVFTGNSSLRRKVTKCNNEPIAHINSGLPLKGNINKMENVDVIKNEKALRTIIKRNLNKEYHGATKPSIDFIYKILDDAYNSGMKYDVSDLYNLVLAFASNSTHQAQYCLSLIPKMHFHSDEESESVDVHDKPLVFYDIEVFPNLLLINWKKIGEDFVHRMINPTSQDVEMLLENRLVGFNNRNYDNHILYARLMGETNEQIYKRSSRIIKGEKVNSTFREATNLSYTDIYDYASTKQSLKKWEIQLGIDHLELGLPWDEPVPEEMWEKVAEYCDNDVIATEAVWNATQDDFIAREILADIAGMSVNNTTNQLTTRIIFGKEKHPKLNYVNLEEEFPGYKFVKTYDEKSNTYIKQNMYRGDDLGFGGYVYSEPGMYSMAALIDVASLHPHSIIAMNLFGEYTKNFKDLVDARVYIKHKQFDKAKELFGGKLTKYLTDVSTAKKLSKALKIAINSVYGLTSAKFDNPFRDIRNENNIVALRGALFMRTLKDEVIARGFTVAHIKTDSIKIPNATKEIIEFCMEFAKKYGYTFEHEATYDRICLVNDAVYIAKFATEEQCNKLYGYAPDECKEEGGLWTATGTQFQIPYVFKTLFSKEKIQFEDMCETKEVKTAIYLDYDEGKEDTTKLEKELLSLVKANENPNRQDELKRLIADQHDRRFVGRVGRFCPIKPGQGGATLVKEVDKKGLTGYDAVTGTIGYRWMESAKVRGVCEESIDDTYYRKLADTAIETISQYGDFEQFVSDGPFLVA